jgi:hypothetical protein
MKRACLAIGVAAVMALLMPAAHAFKVVESDKSGGRVDLTPDPGAHPVELNKQPWRHWSQHSDDGNGTSLHIGGTTLHFSVSPSYGGNSGIESRFVESPAARNVPSQRWPFDR